MRDLQWIVASNAAAQAAYDKRTYTPVASKPSGPENGAWVPACGGTEIPFTSRSGVRLLYCWQPSTGKHAYINCDTDIVMSDDEVRAALGTW
jgi:hypothetical protein